MPYYYWLIISKVIATLFPRTIVAIYLKPCIFIRGNFLCTSAHGPFFHFPSIFITVRLFPVSGTLTFPTVLLTAVTFTPLTPTGLSFFHRFVSYYGQASEFKVAFTKRLSQLFTLLVNYSVCDQRLRTFLSTPFPLLSLPHVGERSISGPPLVVTKCLNQQ